MSNIDSAILYNNIARLYLCSKDYNAAYQASKMSYGLFRIEVDLVLKERLFKASNYNNAVTNGIVNNMSSINLMQTLSFMYFNYGVILGKLKY
jgi:hypothetical protein